MQSLLGEVRGRALLRKDLVVAGTDVRCAQIAGEAVLRLQDQILPIAPPAAEGLAALVPVSSGRALITQSTAVDAWFASRDQVRLIIEDRQVIGILPEAGPPIDGADVLETAISQMQATGHQLLVDRVNIRHGSWMVSLVARDVVDEAVEDDLLYAGVHLSYSPIGDTEACSRVFRLICRNGALTDTADGRRVVFNRHLPSDWQSQLERVIKTGFSGPSLSEDTARLRRYVQETLSSPYEHLCHLVAQGLITADEQVAIQRAFTKSGDQSMYGLINAITSIAHLHRDDDDWRRALAMERLGGEIIRGDHMPPTWHPQLIR